MGACCGRSHFSKTEDQPQMEDMIKEERKPFDEKLQELVMKTLGDAIEAGMKGKDQKEALKEIQENDIKPSEVLKTFTEGVTFVQDKLKKKKYSEFRDL